MTGSLGIVWLYGWLWLACTVEISLKVDQDRNATSFQLTAFRTSLVVRTNSGNGGCWWGYGWWSGSCGVRGWGRNVKRLEGIELLNTLGLFYYSNYFRKDVCENVQENLGESCKCCCHSYRWCKYRGSLLLMWTRISWYRCCFEMMFHRTKGRLEIKERKTIQRINSWWVWTLILQNNVSTPWFYVNLPPDNWPVDYLPLQGGHVSRSNGLYYQ